MPYLLFLGFVVLFLLWMFCAWMDERADCDVPSSSGTLSHREDVSCPDRKSFSHNRASGLKRESSSSERQRFAQKQETVPRVSPAHTSVSQKPEKELPHDHTEYPPETPDTLRPRRVVRGRSPEEDEEGEIPPPSQGCKNRDSQTGEQEEEDPFPSKTNAETRKNVERDNTDLPPLRVSRSVQVEEEQEERGTLSPQKVNRGSQTEIQEAQSPIKGTQADQDIPVCLPVQDPLESSQESQISPEDIALQGNPTIQEK